MNITHVIPYIGVAMGGPVVALAEYAGMLTRQGHPVSVVTVPRPADGPPIQLPEGVEVTAFPESRCGMFRWCPALGRHLGQAPTDLIHSHGLWTYASYAAGQAARRQRIPHILAPCGMLQRDALRRSAWKKRLCRLAFQDRVLRESACLHAKSEAESQGIREFGLRNPVAVIPNSVAVPQDLDQLDPKAFRAAHGLDGRRLVLFVGRIHPVKGVRRLVDAWAVISGQHPDWQLVIAGPDECGMREELLRLCDGGTVRPSDRHTVTLSHRPSVTFLGPLDGMKKWQAYRTADLFVMPSDFENFGTAIVEAMSAGLPVITTTGSPWRELPERGAGWWVAPTACALAQALEQAMSLTDDRRQVMGARAREIALEFTPQEIGGRLVRVYEWLLGAGERPSFVVLD